MLHGQVRVGFGNAAVIAALRPYTFLLVAGGLALLLVASLAKGL
jgi:hypothetical protein